MPVTLATDSKAPVAVAVDSHNVYWADRGTVASGFSDGAVERQALCGGGIVTMVAQQPWPDAIAVDATSVYFANVGGMQAGAEGAILKVPIEGGAVTTLATEQVGPSELAVDATSVYWATLTAIVKCPLGGGGVTTLASGQSPSSMVVDATNVYWSNGPTPIAIMRVSLDGGVPATLVSAATVKYTGIGSIAVDSTRLYWNTADGNVMASAIDGTNVVALASAEYVGTNFEVDMNGLYWANGSGIMRLLLASNVVETLAEQGGVAIALSKSVVVWTTPGFGDSGSIVALPK